MARPEAVVEAALAHQRGEEVHDVRAVGGDQFVLAVVALGIPAVDRVPAAMAGPRVGRA